jgi:hypothetical protein
MQSRHLLLLSVLFVGCASEGSDLQKTYKATGTVTLNGKPVEGATVTFYPVNGLGSSVGVTDSSGKYSLTTFRSNDGAVPGQYKVSIVKVPPGAPPVKSPLPAGQLASGDLDASYAPPPVTNIPEQDSSGPKSEIPAQYANADTSALRGTITESDDNVNDFPLK